MKKNLFIVDKNGYVISFVGENFEPIFFLNLFSIGPVKTSLVALIQVNRYLVTKQPSFLNNTFTYSIKEFDIILQVARFTQ